MPAARKTRRPATKRKVKEPTPMNQWEKSAETDIEIKVDDGTSIHTYKYLLQAGS
jgi:hypothetical protein